MKHIFATIFCILMLSNFAYGYDISPATGNYAINQSTIFTLVAEPNTDNVNSMSLRLLVDGGTITSFSTTVDLVIGVCPGNTRYTSTNICVDIADGAGIEFGDQIGTFQIQWDTLGTFAFTTDNTTYINSVTLEEVPLNGNIGQYIISAAASVTPTFTPTRTFTPTPSISISPTIGELPATAISDVNINILMGIGLVGMGFLLKNYVRYETTD